MRILDRYVCREVFSHAMLGLAVFTFVFFVPQLVRLMELVVRHGSTAVPLCEAAATKILLALMPIRNGASSPTKFIHSDPSAAAEVAAFSPSFLKTRFKYMRSGITSSRMASSTAA